MRKPGILIFCDNCQAKELDLGPDTHGSEDHKTWLAFEWSGKKYDACTPACSGHLIDRLKAIKK